VLCRVVSQLHENKHLELSLIGEATSRVFNLELDRLITECKYFGRKDIAALDIDYIERYDFADAYPIIKQVAGEWYRLLHQVMQNPRSGQLSYSGRQATVDAEIYTILAICCHARSPQRSSFFAGALDVYLHGTGSKRRVVQTLSGLGLCHSYRQGSRLLSDVAEKARVSISFL
jgi:hypothetical protein